ncbi:MAG TPA: sensor histidine kinase [Candidatus Polarisedimenticolia bacterium]|nr:sensor histidine kinase [Candidatus Polarisedimenticolia bacterium]
MKTDKQESDLSGRSLLALRRQLKQVPRAGVRPGGGLGHRVASNGAGKGKARGAAAARDGNMNRANVALSLRTAALAAANQRLKQEIVRRQLVEQALKRSEQHHHQLLKQSRVMQEQLRRLSHRILSAQEKERQDISRELHDEVGQSLTGINITLATLKRESAVNTRDIRRRIAIAERLVEKSLKALRRFVRELRPPILDDMGLIPALDSHLKEFAKRTRVQIRFKAVAAVERCDNEKRTVLYRVAQEALTNIAKHAEATRVSVSLVSLPGAIRMEIRDNGKSFQVNRAFLGKRKRRFGLIGMRERVEMVQGNFQVESARGRGTTVRAEIPFRNEQQGRAVSVEHVSPRR